MRNTQRPPLIGITCKHYPHDMVQFKLGLPEQHWNISPSDYVHSVERVGGIPVLIPLHNDQERTRELLDRLDGVVISGGNDVDPKLYGQYPTGYCGATVPAQDEQEIFIAKYMVERNRPLLGICRGLQIINTAFGGMLYQDVQTEAQMECHNMRIYARNIGCHLVNLSETSKLYSIYQKSELCVNSYHHQGIRSVGPKTEIAGYSADGLIEAIEIKGADFAMGVQWHPEMMYDSEEQIRLWRAFLDACAK